MPRAERSPESKILGFFREAPLSIATTILSLVKDEVRDRTQRHVKKALTPAKAAPLAPAAAPKAKAKKKSHKAKSHKAKPKVASATVESFDPNEG